VDGTFELVGVAGGILVAAGVVLILMGWDGLAERLPSQVPPRRFARYAFVAGGVLLVIAAVALAVPGG
jgi:multisubunit Na+/H+ antiporter MnhB subunit